LSDTAFSAQRWAEFWRNFKGEPQQLEGIEELRQAIAESNPVLMDEGAGWVARFREVPPAPAAPAFGNPLQVPYLHQQDMASDGWRKCFTTCSAMIAEYLGAEPRGLAGERAYDAVRADYGDTTTAEAQLAALRHLGLNAHYGTDGDKQKIINLIDKGIPVGCGWLHHGSVDSPTGGHWSCAVGYDDVHVIMHDPFGEASMTLGIWDQQGSGGEFVKYSWANWLPRWMPGGSGGWYLWATK
jgi:Peptidase_C39 like family